MAGTGAVAGRIVGGELRERRDGWGWLLGDEGSGFWLGREAVRATLTRLQTGSGAARSAGGGRHRGWTGTRDPVAIVQRCYANPPVWLLDLRRAGRRATPSDPVAAAIADPRRRAPGRHPARIWTSIPVLPVVLAGSVATRPGPVREALRARLDERLTNPVLTAESGLVGALWLAAGTARIARDGGRRTPDSPVR